MSERTTVVGAVIVREGRVLAARRTGPAELAGLWEFAGGKVEAGEEPRDALVREIREELDVSIVVGEEVTDGGRPWPISEVFELRLYLTTLLGGTPRPQDSHDRLAWLDPADLRSVPWLPSDARALDAVVSALPG